jgi:hypothetical protein
MSLSCIEPRIFSTVMPRLAADVETVDVRKVDVEDDQVGALGRHPQRLLAAGRLADDEPALAQDARHRVPAGRVVIDV